jgi:hypothetical protein
LRYILRRGWPVQQIELGEEPDGQFIRPEDYADLYLEWARALHAIDSKVELGGPSMQEALTGTWPDTLSGKSWTGRFINELKVRRGLDQLQFFSFENYAFDEVCRPLDVMLREESDLMSKQMRAVSASGMPTSIPWVISEYGFSAFAGRAMSEVPSALLAADIVGRFLTLGGHDAYMLGYNPDQPANENFPCAGFGNMMLFQADGEGSPRWPMPQYYAARMMTQDWGAPADLTHRLFKASTTVMDREGRPVVVAYPLQGPDGAWSVMLVNRDASASHRTPIYQGDRRLLFAGAVGVTQYSSAQYVWLNKGENSHPVKDEPPAHFVIGSADSLILPPMSLTVVRATSGRATGDSF